MPELTLAQPHPSCGATGSLPQFPHSHSGASDSLCPGPGEGAVIMPGLKYQQQSTAQSELAHSQVGPVTLVTGLPVFSFSCHQEARTK